MPYRRRRFARPQRTMRRRFGRRSTRGSYGTTGLRRRSLMRTGGFSGGKDELKFFDLQITNFTLDYDATAPLNTNPLNAMAAGTDYNLRLSRRICNKSLTITYCIAATASATNTQPDKSDFARMLIVYDLQSNGATPAVADVLQSTSIPFDSVLEDNNLNNRARFLTLYDKFHPISTGCAPVYRRAYIKLGGLESTFNAATAGVGSMNTGAIWCFVFSARTTFAQNAGPILQFHSRLRFTDCS